MKFRLMLITMLLLSMKVAASNKGDETMAINITKEDFLKKVMDYKNNPTEWKYLGDKPAIIDFYASWCGPCKMLAPIMEELAKEYDGKMYVYKVDTEAEQELAQIFGIRSIPSILFIPMEGKPMMTQGALPKTELKKIISENLGVN
ncbi:MAG: thioredoxin [Bacteroidales bacterium]|nr:thioredoxin [Lentimicrobiaceae bacterium]MBQ2852270.1 thioredoxin [Bacteroidales bacterium]